MVGHPNSTERDLEWRISFSLQERELMFELNDVQHKCYVLLKMIKRELIRAAIGDSISSYHCKTCLFYMIERNPLDMWRPENLIRCVIQCLQLLLEWANNNYCPNYFIPGENMFDRWMNGSIRENVCRVLTELLLEDSDLLKRIKTDNLGHFLQNRKSYSMLQEEAKIRLEETMFCVQISSVDDTLAEVMILISQTLTPTSRLGSILHFPDDIHFVITRLWGLINYISCKPNAPEHTAKDTQDAIDLLLPFLYTHLASHLASFAMVCNDTKVREEYIEYSFFYFEKGMSSDLASGRLKYSNFLFAAGQYSDCEQQLKALENDFKPCVISVSTGREIKEENYVLQRILANTSLSTGDLIVQYTSSSVIFLPTETGLIPQALQFEMFRLFGAPDNSRYAEVDFWYDWAVVDGKVYLYFLWYLLAVKMNKPVDAISAFLKLTMVSTEEILFHKETAFNLISWVSMKEGFMLPAFKFLYASWKVVENLNIFYLQGLQKTYQTHHNAAKWHMVLLLRNIWQMNNHNNQADKTYDRFCFVCFKQPFDQFKICNVCKIAEYCSKTCQMKNKAKHEQICCLFKKLHRKFVNFQIF